MSNQVYNRTTLQNDTLTLNGHTGPVERLRFMDRYLATGSKECVRFFEVVMSLLICFTLVALSKYGV